MLEVMLFFKLDVEKASHDASKDFWILSPKIFVAGLYYTPGLIARRGTSSTEHTVFPMDFTRRNQCFRTFRSYALP